MKAAELLGICHRQAKRAWARYRERGDAGSVHGLSGRASNRHVQPQRKEQALDLYCEKYAGYSPTLAAECLAQDDGLAVPASTLRVWLSAAGLWQWQRRRKPHSRRRSLSSLRSAVRPRREFLNSKGHFYLRQTEQGDGDSIQHLADQYTIVPTWSSLQPGF